MKKNIIGAVASLFCAAVVAAGGWRGGHSSTAIKMHRVSVPHPQRIQNKDHVVSDQRQAVAPARDDRGVAIHATAVTSNPGHGAVVGNAAVMRSIGTEQRVEVTPGRYYWHSGDGFRYVHYYDRYHTHWYGFYFGPHFYWTRWWGERWWWWDPGFLNWVFWYDGYWWWQGPGGTMYVYVDNNYYPYDEAEGMVTVKNPEVQPPAASEPVVGQGRVWKSPEGSRMVQVSGAQGEAFLYDNSGSEPVFLKYLARNVDKARFSGGTNGRPVEILVDFKDGSFAVFDAQGHPMDSQSSASTDDQVQDKGLPGPPPVGVSAPPAPTGKTAPPPNPPPAGSQ